MPIALIVFIVIPLVEMLVLFEVAEVIGGWQTLTLVVLTAVIGVQILKQQGLSTLLRANQRLQEGQLPAQEIVEGFMLAAAGAMLLTPGFITDTLGFLFLTGPVRRPLASRIVSTGMLRAMGSGQGGGQFWSHREYRRDADGNIYEGEYSRTDSEWLSDGKKGDSGDDPSMKK